ncbi:MAG: hypothetical protein HY848_03120 [Betaproteobacteria bacterium]|nr:hypothetical protein [Betaproteobacteria bacterium]
MSAIEADLEYLALGDRHSFTPIDNSGRIFYSGTHEAYDFGELDPDKDRTRAAEAAEKESGLKESGLVAQLREAEEDIGRFATLERSVTLNSRASSRLR